MSKLEFPINYGIIATVPHPSDPDKLSVVHFVGFANKPGLDEFEAIYVELKTDQEFGLSEVDFDLHEAPEDVVNHFRSVVETEEIHEEE